MKCLFQICSQTCSAKAYCRGYHLIINHYLLTSHILTSPKALPFSEDRLLTAYLITDWSFLIEFLSTLLKCHVLFEKFSPK